MSRFKFLSMMFMLIVMGITVSSCKSENSKDEPEPPKETSVTFRNGLDVTVRDLEVRFINSSGEKVKTEAAGDVAPNATKVFNTKGYAKVYFVLEVSGTHFMTADVDVIPDENVVYTLTESSYVYTLN